MPWQNSSMASAISNNRGTARFGQTGVVSTHMSSVTNLAVRCTWAWRAPLPVEPVSRTNLLTSGLLQKSPARHIAPLKNAGTLPLSPMKAGATAPKRNKQAIFVASPKPSEHVAVNQHVQEIQGLPSTTVKGQDSTRRGFPG